MFHQTTARPVVMVRNALLVEDTLINQRVVFGLLTKRGHAVTVVNTGKEALAALERQRFDIVLMDVQMPEMDGLEATARIRERERRAGGHTHIVALTAHAMAGDRERCLAAGMDGYLTKPVDPQALFEAVERSATGATPARTEPFEAVIDRTDLLRRLCGDQELLATVIALFLDDCPARLAAIKRAVEARDREGIRTAAHALKSAAATLSARGVAEAAHALEQMGASGDLDHVTAAWPRLVAAGERLLMALGDEQPAELICAR